MTRLGGDVPNQCDNRDHFEYRTWPIALPTSAAFRCGRWPKVGSRLDYLWAWARSLGLIRMRHKSHRG